MNVVGYVQREMIHDFLFVLVFNLVYTMILSSVILDCQAVNEV